MAIVCSCHGVRDHHVEEAVVAGARTVEDVGEACAAGIGCGGCHPNLEQLLEQLVPGAVTAA